MPGLVVFRRRWSVGSDDLVVPGAFLFTVHLIWTIVLTVVQIFVHFDKEKKCVWYLWLFILCYIAILVLSMAIELTICIVAMRGSILDTTPRSSMQYILYLRLAVMFLEAGWLGAGVAWLVNFYKDCPIDKAKETVLGLIVCNWCIILSVIITVWCTYDAAGRSWVKMKQYQRSMKESESKFQYKRSGSTRNWRQRKVLRAYQDSWHQRCRFLFCCSGQSDRNRNSFTDIARLLSEFFRDLDVVPSDVVAGLVLLRKFQKIERKSIVEQRKNDTYEFLSGVPITSKTQFLSLHDGGADLELFQAVIHYAHFAVRAYGWPMMMMTTKFGLCKLCPNLSCCCIPCRKPGSVPEVVDDNCCRCNYAALQKLTDEGDIEIVYATYHVDIGETPFFIALDYDRKKVVISIRGTLSMKDILTDLNAEGETLPLQPVRDDWLGHKGMVQAAQYICDRLQQEHLIEHALQHKPERGTQDFQLVIVGHSLGAGTASILGILLRQWYKDLQCFCYSPPGGLLSMPAVEYSKDFTVSVVVGKDVVPRIGLHQMEALRADLINAIKRSVDPKWKTITCSLMCCSCVQPTSAVEMSTGDGVVSEYTSERHTARDVGGFHPSDSTIALTSHEPLYPPGRIIHVVRHHPGTRDQALGKREPVYQALWAHNIDFDEVLISPVMIQDHMPDKVLDALNKVITTLGPRKPQRKGAASKKLEEIHLISTSTPPQHRLCLETSFTSLQSPSAAPSNASSITNGYFSTKSQPSPVQIGNILTLFNNDRVSDFNLALIETKQPKSFSLNLCRSPCAKIDLIHDDWFGLAPLASPESLSELSIISSRASLMASCDRIDAEVCVERRTPLVMKRTPKMIGSLSTCADDIRNVKIFEKSLTFRRKFSQNGSHSSSSHSSFESASALVDQQNTLRPPNLVDTTNSGESDEFQSAEDILDNLMDTAGCKEFFNSTPSFLETHFDLTVPDDPKDSPKLCRLVYQSSPQLLSPSSPQDVDQDLISNFAIDLNLDEHNRSMQMVSSKSASVDSGSACRTPSDCKNVTFNPQVVNIESPSCSSPKRKDKWNLLPFKTKQAVKCKIEIDVPKAAEPPKTILSNKRRGSDEDFFARTEALPLLSGLGGGLGDSNSPGFVRRKKYVYPSDIAIMNKSHESNV